jgi:hypothetical protein
MTTQHTNNRYGAMVFGLIALVALVIVIVTVVQNNAAKAKEHDRQVEHDTNVSYYSDHCNVNGAWVC